MSPPIEDSESTPIIAFAPRSAASSTILLTAYEAERQHREQQENIRDLVKAVHDFLDAAQKVKPEYQQQAQQAVFAAIFERMMQSQYGGINK